MFGNNALTAPVEEISFTSAKRKESAPRVSPLKDDCFPLACTKGGPDYLVAYQGFLEELAKICPDACIFKSLPKLDPEETDTAESDANISTYYSFFKVQDKSITLFSHFLYFSILYMCTLKGNALKRVTHFLRLLP